MIFGGYGKGKEDLPRVFQISIARFSRELPDPGEPLPFPVAIHEEGTGITWQQNITVEPKTERSFLDTTKTLYRRGLGSGGGTPESALAAVEMLGRKLWETFHSACESGHAAGGARLVSDTGQANGLAAAFLACGAAAYAGYFWPVTDDGSCRFTETFYPALFGLENTGLAFQDARKSTVWDLAQAGDLSGFSAVLFGDAASPQPRKLQPPSASGSQTLTGSLLRLRTTWPVRRQRRARCQVKPASSSTVQSASSLTVGRRSRARRSARHNNCSDDIAVPSCSGVGCRRTSVRMRARSAGSCLRADPSACLRSSAASPCRSNSLSPRATQSPILRPAAAAAPIYV